MQVAKHLILISIAAVTVAGCFVQWLPDPFAEEREKRLDGLIAKNERLRRLDHLCKEIGAAQKFKLLRRSIAKDESELYFYFETGMTPLQVSNNYATYFRDKAWGREEWSQAGRAEFFRKDGLAVNIQYGGIGGEADIGITCFIYLDSNSP